MNKRDAKDWISKQLLEVCKADKCPVERIEKRLVRKCGEDARDRRIEVQAENDNERRSEQDISKRRLAETFPPRPKVSFGILSEAAGVLFLSSHNGLAIIVRLAEKLKLVILRPLLERVVKFLSCLFRTTLLVDDLLERFGEVIDDQSPIDWSQGDTGG